MHTSDNDIKLFIRHSCREVKNCVTVFVRAIVIRCLQEINFHEDNFYTGNEISAMIDMELEIELGCWI